MRGGTSRALVFHRDDLPRSRAAQDRMFLAALGCPDPTGRQVDGLGGGASSNNKVAIVGPSREPGVDVDYTLGQLSPDRNFVDRAGNCGNISSAIGPFAIEERIVSAVNGVTPVTIRNTNSGQLIIAHVPTPSGRFMPEGDYEIAGVAGSGARIVLDFVEPGGGHVLPTGAPWDTLSLPDGTLLRCSLTDAGKPSVLIPFAELDLEPAIRPEQLDTDLTMLERIEAVRAVGAVAMGVARSAAEATATTPAVPQLTFFAPASAGSLQALGISMGKAHRALPLTAAVSLAAAASIPGTLVADAAGRRAGFSGQPLTLIHPSGQIEVTALVASGTNEIPRIERVSIARTARRLFAGVVYTGASR